MKYKPSSILPAPCGKKKEREATATGERSSKTTASFIPDFEKEVEPKHRGVGSLAVTHDHWADINTSKSWVRDILIPYYNNTCKELKLVARTQRCILLVDCWWGWLDREFRDWLKQEHPYVLLLYVPASCTPVAQPNDSGVIAILKGKQII